MNPAICKYQSNRQQTNRRQATMQSGQRVKVLAEKVENGICYASAILEIVREFGEGIFQLQDSKYGTTIYVEGKNLQAI